METLTIPELSKYLNISSQTIRKLVKNGDLPFFKVGDTVKFSKNSIDEWIHNQELFNYQNEKINNSN